MEFFVVTIISLLLLPLILGWAFVVAALIITPIFSMVYLFGLVLTKLNLGNEFMLTDDVLIVDDQYQTVIPLLKLLEQAKIPFKYVANGFEAMNEMSAKHYKLVFMDYYMPAITGVEALVKVDQLLSDNGPKTPVIFYTGAEITEKEKSGFKNLSILDSWNKSMTRMELNSRLSQVLMSHS